MNINCHILNLANDSERLNKTINVLSQLSINSQRFNAINGHKINHSDHITTTSERKHTRGQYGCLLSHLTCIKSLKDKPEDIFMIAEDDLTTEYFRPNINLNDIISNAPKNWEIIRLCYSCVPRLCDKIWDCNQDYYLSYKNIYCAGLYVINKRGINRICQLYDDNAKKWILNTETIVADVLIFETCKTYIYKYPPLSFEIHESKTANTKDNRIFRFRERNKSHLTELLKKKFPQLGTL
jgi:GR25 family glycosyltransferase involved in LPS biosynthesis